MKRTNEPSEDYLETILILSKELPVVRSVDIANELGFTKASVSVAMKKLRETDMILMDSSGFITLTEKGNNEAGKIYERHIILSEWLISIGITPEIAKEDACRMEHIISAETFQVIKEHYESEAPERMV